MVIFVFFANVLCSEAKKDDVTKATPGYETKKSTASAGKANPVLSEKKTAKAVDKRTDIQKLSDKNWITRRNAAITLGSGKNKKAVMPLI